MQRTKDGNMDVWQDQAHTIAIGPGSLDIILHAEHKRDGQHAKVWMTPQTAREIGQRLIELADERDAHWDRKALETRR